MTQRAHGIGVGGPFALPSTDLGLIGQLWVPALLISIIGFVESVSVAQTLAAKRRQRIAPNQELIGLGVYTLAVLLIGLAPNLTLVFGLRIVQAIGNGLLLASIPALVTSISPPEERGQALGVMSGVATLGLITGALVGGVLVDLPPQRGF